MKKIFNIFIIALLFVLVIGVIFSTSNFIRGFLEETDTTTSRSQDTVYLPDSEPIDPDITDRPEEPTIISFTIDGVSYLANEDMSWGEWVYSYYAKDAGLQIVNNTIMAGDNTYLQLNGSNVFNTDIVKANGAYQRHEVSTDPDVTDPPEELTFISFTIDGVSYLAHEGMSWGEWVYSSYGSNAGLEIVNETIMAGENTYLQLNGSNVTNTDIVQANGAYQRQEVITDPDVNDPPVEPTTITFTIDGKSYQADADMSWGEWVYSSYGSNSGLEIMNNTIMAGENTYLQLNGSNVINTDIVQANGAYQRQEVSTEPDEPDEPDLISFTIDGDTYEAQEGMTWGEWVYSSYGSNAGLEILNNNVMAGENTYLQLNGLNVLNTHIIQEFGSYLSNNLDLISFTIRGTTYHANQGMTWGEWLESDYNTSIFVVGEYDEAMGGYTIMPEDDYSVALNGTTQEWAVTTDVIVAGTAYRTISW